MNKTVLTTGLAAALALTLAACGGGSGSASSAADDASTSATGTVSETVTSSDTETTSAATSTDATASDSTSAAALSGNVSALSDWSQELSDARISTQENMKAVMNDWDANAPMGAIDGGQAGLDAAYQEALAEIEAKRDEGLAAIDATTDPDEVKEYWKADIEDEYQQYLEGMQKSYENAKAFVTE